MLMLVAIPCRAARSADELVVRPDFRPPIMLDLRPLPRLQMGCISLNSLPPTCICKGRVVYIPFQSTIAVHY